MIETISAEFPFESKYIDVLDSKLHYIDEGEGDPILFIHGVPTSSYLWRNIVPTLAKQGRCIAVDLIGFGQSGKPDIEYSVHDHIRYITAFIEALSLKNVTLMMHAWGSVVGFSYAAANLNNIKALAFVESHVRPPENMESISLPIQEVASVLAGPDGGYDVIMNSNYYVNKVLQSGVLRRLSDQELAVYNEPFAKAGSCKPIWQFLQEMPLGDEPNDVSRIIQKYSKILQKSDVPKLMFYAVPGFVTTIDTVIWARDHFPNLKLVDLGDALHYPQETNPELIATELSKWYGALETVTTA